MHPLQFFIFLFLSGLCLLGIMWPMPYGLLAIGMIFGGIPLLDWLVGESRLNPSPEQERSWKRPFVWAPALYVYSLTHFSLLIYSLMRAQSFTWSEVILAAVVLGIYTGGAGITVAHELCHKKEWFHRLMAELLLCSVWYQHFVVEHVKGHHLKVATAEDPASARKNETVYAFVWRSVTGSFLHAFKLDSFAVSRGVIISLLATVGAAMMGPKVLVLFLLEAVVAFTLLELVNYIEHYGLARRPLGDGRFEKVTPMHSWNSSHKISNLLLFNLQRHSDHHALAHLPYTVLKHHAEAPQLPSGYPGMILLALVPPIWFKKMNPMLDKIEHS